MSVLTHRQTSSSSESLRPPHGAASVHLDALRGIAAVGVCLNHMRDIFFRDYPQLPHHSPALAILYLATGLGRQWVMVFFVLSGYLVGGSVLRAHATGRWAWGEYLFNRSTRLYIVLLPALLLGGLWDIAGLHLFGTGGIYGGHTGSHAIDFAVRNNLSWSALLGNYAFVQTIFVPTLGSNGPLWSLANEFWYYIAFPALAIAVLRRSSLVERVTHAVLFLAVLVLAGRQIDLLGLVWLMGVLLHFLPPIRMEHAVGRRLLLAVSLIALPGALAWSRYAHSAVSDYVLGVVVMLLMYVLLHCSRTDPPKWYKYSAQRLSHSSYTLYLAHLPMVVFLAALLEARFGQVRWLPDARHLAIGAGLFLLVFFYAQLVWFVFEKRTDAVRARLKPVLKPHPVR